jgi:hypothetical protein
MILVQIMHPSGFWEKIIFAILARTQFPPTATPFFP